MGALPPGWSGQSTSKYHNKRTTVDGITFASKREANRYVELTLMQRAGLISNLRLQVRYPLVVNGVKVGAYLSDFTYVDEHGIEVVEDVKGGEATKTAVYRLKKNLMRALHGIAIREV